MAMVVGAALVVIISLVWSPIEVSESDEDIAEWKWRGSEEKGSWYNPNTGETLHPDLNYPEPEGPHWDYIPYKNGSQYRIYPDGTIVPKQGEKYMIEKNDWRLSGQDEYMKDMKFYYTKFAPNSGKSLHIHCEFCWHKFMEDPQGIEDCSSYGYSSLDGKYWVCTECFDDFKELFKWKLIV